MANEATVGEVEFLAAVDLLKPLNPEEREPVILALEHDYPGIGDKLRAELLGGCGCLNRISASISGASAGVRPPRGKAAS